MDYEKEKVKQKIRDTELALIKKEHQTNYLTDKRKYLREYINEEED